MNYLETLPPAELMYYYFFHTIITFFTVFRFVMYFLQIIINHPPTHFTSRHSLCSFYRVCSFSCCDDSFFLDRLYRLPRVVASGKNTKWSLHNQPWWKKRVWSLLRSTDKRWWVGCLPKAIPWLGWLLPRLGELQSWIWYLDRRVLARSWQNTPTDVPETDYLARKSGWF